MESLSSDKLNHRIIVAGIGPGHPDYMIPAAKTAIEGARALIGGRRALEQFGHPNQRQMAITRDIPGVMTFIRSELQHQDVVVMASGDPGYYSILDAIRREFPRDIIHVIPGISSVQLAFSRLALPWHGAKLLSFHGRLPKTEDLRFEKNAVLGMLTDGEYDSQSIPKLLMKEGWPPDSSLAICARLSYEDERIIETTLSKAAEMEPIKHGILIVREP